MDPNYFFVRNTTFLARQYNWSNMFNTITTCRLSHYFRLKTCSSFLSHSQVFHLMFVIKYVTVLSGKYPANFTRIPDSTGCPHFTGYRIVLSGSGTSLPCWRYNTKEYIISSIVGSSRRGRLEIDCKPRMFFCFVMKNCPHFPGH